MKLFPARSRTEIAGSTGRYQYHFDVIADFYYEAVERVGEFVFNVSPTTKVIWASSRHNNPSSGFPTK